MPVQSSTPDNIVIAMVPNEAALLAELAKARAAHVPMRVITEPDLGGRATAITSCPVSGLSRKPFRRWRLWTPPSQEERGVIATVGSPAPGENPGLLAISPGSSVAERRDLRVPEVARSNPAPATISQHVSVAQRQSMEL